MTSPADEVRIRTDQAWRDFRDALTRVEMEAPTSSGWQTKEMVAHIAFWMETVPPFVTGAFRGDEGAFNVGFPSGYLAGDGDWPVADVHNAREAEWARTQSNDAIMARLHRAYEEFRTFLETVTDEEVEAQAPYFREIADHLDQHRISELIPT